MRPLFCPKSLRQNYDLPQWLCCIIKQMLREIVDNFDPWSFLLALVIFNILVSQIHLNDK